MADVALLNSERGRPKRNRSKTRREDTESLASNNTDDGVKQNTKAAFDVLLKQALANNDTQTKSRKKKEKTNTRDVVLASLIKGEGIKKEEDQSIIANTYDPRNDDKLKKNNHRQQSEIEDTGTDNLGYDENEDFTTKKEKKRKPKKATPSNVKDSSSVEDRTMTISELAPLSVQKKKKKKRDGHKETEIQSQDDLRSGHLLEEEILPDQQDLSQNVEADLPIKKTRRKKKKKVVEQDSGEELDRTGTGDEVEEETANVPAYIQLPDDGRVLGVTIHRTDRLKTDFFIAHPLIRVHVVDIDTGNCLKKSDQSRAVTSYFENRNENVDYILPVMTQPFDFKKQKSMLPVWEELLMFNENCNYLTQEDSKAIIFFELLDFVSMSAASRQERGWHRIAWAFLKLVAGNGKLNIEKKVRLQLFLPPARFRSVPDQVEVYQWWRKVATRIPYPSTLYVTIKRILPPPKVTPASRSMFALQEERGKMTYRDLKKSLDAGPTYEGDEGKSHRPSTWGRLPGQICKIPNTIALSLPSGKRGCSVLKFSLDGNLLACGCHDAGSYPILIYEVPSGNLKVQLQGHHGIIYDLSWGKNNKKLLSASSDSTAKLWNIETANEKVEKLFPHPTFVYSAQFHVRVNKVVVTGGYDRVIRIWSTQGDSRFAHLEQELEGHLSHINAVCFDEEGQKMFSGDGVGVLRVWNCYVTDQPSKRGVLRDWNLFKEIVDDECKGSCINHIQLHHGGRRLLIHSRDNTIRMMDLRVYSIMQRYMGALNFREQIRSTVTPCGSFVISGSEDCAAYVWNTETGDQVAMYSDMNYKHTVCCASFHPHDHMVAFCAFGENQPITIYRYDLNVAQYEAGYRDLPGAYTTSGLEKISKTTAITSAGILTAAHNQTKSAAEDSKADTVINDFSTNETARMQRIERKLESVLAFTQTSQRNTSSPDATVNMPGMVTSNSMMSWGSTFDTTTLGMGSQMTRSGSPVMTAFSPHASRSQANTMQQQQFSSHNQYMKQAGGSWRPGFSPVGKQVAGYAGRPPQMSLNTTQGKAQFSFQAPASGRRHSEQVVALYDYAAQRSDELSFVRGDVITVLYKDNENWWMGELNDESQGFFPSNYVAERCDMSSGYEEAENHVREKPELCVEPESTSRLHAVISERGEYKLISEDSDTETPVKKSQRRKKLQQKHHANVKDITDTNMKSESTA